MRRSSFIIMCCIVIVANMWLHLTSQDAVVREVHAERRVQHLWRQTVSKMPFG